MDTILYQIKESKKHSIRFKSSLWIDPEKKYNAQKKECRALLRALKKLKVWLYVVNFVVEIDPKTLLHQLNLAIVDLPEAIVMR